MLSSLVSFTLFLIFLAPLAADQPKSEYLKLPLLHKNPFPNPTQTFTSDTHRLSILFSALHTHRTIKSPVVSGAYTGSGQYFVDIRLGTPPQKLLLVADTGSDLVWVKCSACKNCSQHFPGSAFLARHSTTFSPHHCFDPACRLVPNPKNVTCNHTHLHSPCRYEYSYVDGSISSGFFSKETATLNTSAEKQTKIQNLSFGCGFSVSGPSLMGSSFNGAQGVMGLGRGSISFPSQLGRRFGDKFAYCLMDYTISPPPTSYLLIGGQKNNIIDRNLGLSFTPLLANPLSPTFYYIRIKRVYVNRAKLRIDPVVWSIDQFGNGGTVIDSGTTLTFLAEPAYTKIISAFKKRVKLPSPTESPPDFELCVNVSGVSTQKLPRLRFELEGNVVFSPPARNYFIETAKSVKCLAIQPVKSESGFSVMGNLMQQGYLLEFDKERSLLGFSRRGCALP